MAWVKARKRGGRTRYTGAYRDAAGRERSAGTFDSSREAMRKAREAEGRIEAGTWVAPEDGKITFQEYVDHFWWPSLGLEVSTLAAYRSYLDAHFTPALGHLPLRAIVPSTVQAWVNRVNQPKVDGGLSPSSIHKYHAMLHSLFKQAIVDKKITHNPCDDTRLPKKPKRKVMAKKRRIVTPEQFDRIVQALPTQYVPIVLTAIETGVRWGELVALRPRHIETLRRRIRIEQVIVEVSKRNSPTGERYIVKDYPKDDEPRTLRVSQDLIDLLAVHIARHGIGPDDLLFTAVRGGPMSRHTFREDVWKPAVKAAGVGCDVQMRSLRHTHATWALKGGATVLAIRDRLGHDSVTTTELYLVAMEDDDDEALDAFAKIRQRGVS